MVARLVAIYGAIRLFSFFTYQQPVFNELVAVCLLLYFTYVCWRKLSSGWLLLVGELLLGGSGHFFEVQGLLLRTWILGIFILIWLYRSWQTKKILLPERPVWRGILGFGGLVLIASALGLYFDHQPRALIQDAITYGFIGLLLPAQQFWHELRAPGIALIKAWIIGSTIFSTGTLFIYSSGIGTLPDTYYHWFRNSVGGKITDLGNHFFRIVLPEHIILVPILLAVTAWLIRESKNKVLWLLQACLLITLALNFSRIYFLALGAGLLVLAYQQNKRLWWRVSSGTVILLFFLFISLHTLSSRGTASGLGLFGLRLGGTTAPSSDVSGAIRLAILPDALAQIKARPLFGSGLGATITYVDPVSQQSVTRTQFDWGYLELLAEFGVVGLTYLLLFGFLLLRNLWHSFIGHNKNNPLYSGLLAGIITLGIMNLTTPALFHGFGILYIVFILAATTDAWPLVSDAPVRSA